MKKLTSFRKPKPAAPRPDFAREVEKQEREHERARIQHWLEIGEEALVTEPQDDADPEAA